MDRESMKRLRLDRRLIRRSGWISEQDLERELAGLPDVSEKIQPPAIEDAEADGSDESPGASAPE